MEESNFVTIGSLNAGTTSCDKMIEAAADTISSQLREK